MTPDPDPWRLLSYARTQVTLMPERFGVMGSYSRDMLDLQAYSDPDSFMMDRLVLQLTTQVLCGRTVSEEPEVQVNVPASPWQHLKVAAARWHAGWLTGKWMAPGSTPPPWAVLLAPAYYLLRWFLRRYPPRYTKVTARVQFEQHVMYPEIDYVPAQFGRPVIFEETSVSYPGGQPPFGSRFTCNPSRFLSKHEVIRDITADCSDDLWHGHPAITTLNWLEQHGVNTDQMVRRPR